MNRRERVAATADHRHLLSDVKMKKATVEWSHPEGADSSAKAPTGEVGHRKKGADSQSCCCCWCCSDDGDVNA